MKDIREATERPALDPPAGVPLAQRRPDAPAPGARLSRHGDMCLVCGAAHPAGLRARMFAGEGASTRAEIDITDAHQGQDGMAHGGLLAAAFDEIMGAVNWLVGPPTVTGRLDVVYRVPVPTNRSLHFHAWSTGLERRKSYVSGECRLDSSMGVLAATASAVFIRPNAAAASH